MLLSNLENSWRIGLRYLCPEDRIFFNHVISDFFVVLKDTPLTISDTIETVSLVEIRNSENGFQLVQRQ